MFRGLVRPLCCASAFLALFFLSTPARKGSWAGQPEPCPSTAQAWADWRQRILTTLDTPQDLGDGRANPLTTCRPGQEAIFQNNQFQECMGPLLAAAGAMASLQNNTGKNDAILDDPQTYRSPRPVPLNEMFKLPEPFKNSKLYEALKRAPAAPFGKPKDSDPPPNLNPALKAQLEQIQKKNPGFTMVQYRPVFFKAQGGEAFVSTFPDPPPPDEPNFDRYVHVLRAPNGVTSGLSMLTVQRKDASGAPLNPPQVYFSEFPAPGASPSPPKPGGSDGMSKMMSAMHGGMEGGDINTMTCFRCHRTGAMPAVVTMGAVSFTPGKNAVQAINAFNRQVSSTATAVPAKFNMKGFGPPIGPKPSDSDRSDDFIKQCSKPLAPNADQIKEIRGSMNCVSCHDGSMAGPLSAPLGPTDFVLSPNMLEGHITSGHMPPGGLPENERAALYRCLVSEYYAGFKDPRFGGNPGPGLFLKSLSARPCPTSIPAAPASTARRDAPTAKDEHLPAKKSGYDGFATGAFTK